jgi:hypothetical protein
MPGLQSDLTIEQMRQKGRKRTADYRARKKKEEAAKAAAAKAESARGKEPCEGQPTT